MKENGYVYMLIVLYVNTRDKIYFLIFIVK